MKSEQIKQSLESQLQMARPRRAEVKRVPLTGEEKEFLGEIMDKAVAAEKAGKLQEALDLYTDYKNELLRIKEKKEQEITEHIFWTKEKLVKWVEDVFKTPEEGLTFEEMAHRIFDMEKLPKLETTGDLNLPGLEIKEFPADMTIFGRLDLDSSVVKKWIGSDLDINGDVLMNESQVETLPANMHVDGSLYLADSSIKDLPDNLYVEFDIWVKDCDLNVIKKAKKLKKEGKIKGDVKLI